MHCVLYTIRKKVLTVLGVVRVREKEWMGERGLKQRNVV